MRPMRGRVFALCVLAACAHDPAPSAGPVFGAPGSLLYVTGSDDGSALYVAEGGGSQRVPEVSPLEARWVDRDRILVVEEIPLAEGEYGLPLTRMRIVDRQGRTLTALGEPGRHYDAEPSPDGAWLAVGADAPSLGDSDLEIWELSPPYERVAVRHQSLEEPRWRQDGRALVASVLMADPETDDDTGGGMLGTSFTWPRLHRIRADLGDPTFLWDGPDAESLAPGGSLALWWDGEGIFARQSRGLVRCDAAAGGCALVFDPGPSRRIVDGRRAGAHEAWLLTTPLRDAFDRSPPDRLERIDWDTGRILESHPAPPEGAFRDFDYLPPPPP